jgi:hypothetical protein
MFLEIHVDRSFSFMCRHTKSFFFLVVLNRIGHQKEKQGVESQQGGGCCTV